ncbi:MAG: hypothetical protein AB7G28_16425 [Pirellulales bacterium]
MTTPVTSADPAANLARLQQLLFALIRQNDPHAFGSASAIPAGADLSTIGITSVDFLEFALSVEQEFGVMILDTIDPNELPLTLEAWQQQVSARLAAGPA